MVPKAGMCLFSGLQEVLNLTFWFFWGYITAFAKKFKTNTFGLANSSDLQIHFLFNEQNILTNTRDARKHMV